MSSALKDSIPVKYKGIGKNCHLLILAGIFIVAFVIRLFSWWMEPVVARDGVLYVNMVESWYKLGSYHAMLAEFPRLDGIPIFALFLMKLLMETGISGETAGISLVMVLGSLLPLITYTIAIVVCEKKEIALGAALLAALHPALIGMSIQIMRDTPYLFFIGTSMLCLLSAMKYRKWWQWSLGGIMLTLAMLTRYESIETLFLVFGCLLAAFLFKWISWRKMGIYISCFLVSSLLTAFFVQIAIGISPEKCFLQYYNYIKHIYNKKFEND